MGKKNVIKLNCISLIKEYDGDGDLCSVVYIVLNFEQRFFSLVFLNEVKKPSFLTYQN